MRRVPAGPPTPAPQLFIVPPQAVYFLRLHPVGVGVNRHLIEIVGAAALQGHQLLDRGKVYMENVTVSSGVQA